jgi:hypothetical protein
LVVTGQGIAIHPRWLLVAILRLIITGHKNRDDLRSKMAAGGHAEKREKFDKNRILTINEV